ncbi:hypothetical protein ScPMuIL_017256 [Solemya velum]
MTDCLEQIDLVLVVDGSDSISDDDFETLRASLGKLTDALSIAPDEVRVGIVVYSTGIAAEVALSGDKGVLQEDISTLPHPQDGTETYEGIQAMTDMILSQGRPDVPKVGVVITDGKSKNSSRTAAAAEDARNMGIKMLAVGVTREIEMEELQAIASKNKWVLSVDGFDELANALKSLVTLICPQTTAETTVPTTTTETTVPTTTAETTVPTTTGHPCDNCRIVNGVGYTSHPDDCDKYIQCYFGEGRKVKSVVRQCGFATLWDQSKLTCAHYTDVTCTKDPCQYPFVHTRPYDIANSAYWECVYGKSVPRCCHRSIYSEHSGCGEHKTFGVDSCPPVHPYVNCNLKEHEDSTRYQLYQEGWGWRSMPCAPGTRFSLEKCACAVTTNVNPPECKPELYVSFDGDTRDHSGKHVYVRNVGVIVDRNAGRNGAGFFDGNSYLSIPRFSNIDVESYLKIQFIYKETNDSHLPMALITNADCGSQGTIGVGQDFHTVFFGLRDSVGDLVKTSVEKKTTDWKEVEFIHDGKVLEGRVDRLSQQVRANGRFQTDACALKVGYWGEHQESNFQSFIGYIDELYVWQCKP